MFDVGIAEQHAVTFAAGLAVEGFKPFCAIYSTFLQRAYDQIVHDVALQRLPVRFAIDRAGLVGQDGPTHAGSFDIAYLACLPDFVVMAAADEAELVHMVATAAAIDDRPSAFRYPRGEGVGVDLPEQGVPLEIGRGRVVREGAKVALLSFGARLQECLKAADHLQSLGLSTTVADARFAKPLDEDLIRRLVAGPRSSGDRRGRRHRRLRHAGPALSGARQSVRATAAVSRPCICPTASSRMPRPRSNMTDAGLTEKTIVAEVMAAFGDHGARAGFQDAGLNSSSASSSPAAGASAAPSRPELRQQDEERQQAQSRSRSAASLPNC